MPARTGGLIMKWYLCLAWVSIGGLAGFIICALFTISRITELIDTIERLQEYIHYILNTEEN